MFLTGKGLHGGCNALLVGNCWAYSQRKILVLKDATYTVACEHSVTPIVTRKSALRVCVGSACVCVCAANMHMSVASVFMLKFLDARVSLLLFGSVHIARDISGYKECILLPKPYSNHLRR